MTNATSQPVGPSYQESKSVVNDVTVRNLGKLFLLTAALTGSARAGVGLIGSIRRNLARKKRENEDNRPDVPDITFATKSAADVEAPLPWWFTPAAAVGTPLAGAAGWMGVSKIMKMYRKSQAKRELADAKKEFEDALAYERGTDGSKFAADLHDLAEAYVAGDIDTSIDKSALVNETSRVVRGAVATILALSAGAGAVGGWKLLGQSPEALRVKAYKEYLRRRRVTKLPGLVAMTKAKSITPQHEETTTTPNADEEEEYDSTKSAVFSNELYRSVVPALCASRGSNRCLQL